MTPLNVRDFKADGMFLPLGTLPRNKSLSAPRFRMGEGISAECVLMAIEVSTSSPVRFVSTTFSSALPKFLQSKTQ